MSASVVLDASALIALLADERGGEQVVPLLDGALLSTVNWSEVLARYTTLGLATGERAAQLESLGVVLVAFTARQAEIAAGLIPITRVAGLSLADRACLALALDTGGDAVTADRAWSRVDVGVAVRIIR